MKDSSRRQFLKGMGVTGGALTMGGFPLAETSSVRQGLDSGSAQPNSEGMGKTNEARREWPAGNPYTRGIAEFVSGLTVSAIPSDVRHRIKLLMLDSVGCAIYGANLPWSQILQGNLNRLDETRSCTVWGTRYRLSAPHAALVNGTEVQGFELDDVHRRAVLHVGAVVLPAVFAVAETRKDLTGIDLITAAVAGYEIGPRVGICMGPEHISQGWHSDATLGVFSAGAGAARALQLDADKTVHALGIAGTQAAGLMAAQYGSMVKRMHAGRAAQSGLYGALFAEAGFTGITNVLESEYGGFCTTFSRSKDRFNLSELTAGLGQVWQTMEISLKFYSCVASNHTTLDAIRSLQADHHFTRDDVRRIVVYASQATVDHVGWKYVPQGLTSAQLNLSYCVATFLIEGNCFVDQFTEEKVADPERMALAEKVEVKHDPEITNKGSKFRHMVRVQVELKDGRILEKTVQTPRGSESNFATDEDVVAKFQNLAGHVLPRPKVEQIRDKILDLEALKNVTGLVRSLGIA
jgi:2-methylcitrate dehydratase PrpD